MEYDLMTYAGDCKLWALREAARVGVDALERGQFKEFENVEDLCTYLNDLAAEVIYKTFEQ
ncbi:MAG TPA: hypothetical protein VKX28_18330 [Xanthobacteraceae bacterium]|nr:hypothetical protein [Xanthobacteraceae bacterium]